MLTDKDKDKGRKCGIDGVQQADAPAIHELDLCADLSLHFFGRCVHKNGITHLMHCPAAPPMTMNEAWKGRFG